LPDDTVKLTFIGSAGQSFAAFCPRGMTFLLIGDANDYFGKGLSGAHLVVRPDEKAPFTPEENIVIGNVAFYGATSGEAFIRGMGGERFCVRNSGVHTVIEGVGDHCCEYMTGGRVVVIGPTGRNFAAGMSGGFAYVLDEDDDFEIRCNTAMVDLERVRDADEIDWLKRFIARHVEATGSTPGQRVLDNWDTLLPKFVKVAPRDYKRALAEQKQKAEAERALSAATEGD
jgi:glutamate synthase (ferredoxin)